MNGKLHDEVTVLAKAFVWFTVNHDQSILEGMEVEAREDFILTLYLEWLLEQPC